MPSLIITDQHLPRWSGLEVLRWLRSSPHYERLLGVIVGVLSPVQAEAEQHGAMIRTGSDFSLNFSAAIANN